MARPGDIGAVYHGAAVQGTHQLKSAPANLHQGIALTGGNLNRRGDLDKTGPIDLHLAGRRNQGAQHVMLAVGIDRMALGDTHLTQLHGVTRDDPDPIAYSGHLHIGIEDSHMVIAADEDGADPLKVPGDKGLIPGIDLDLPIIGQSGGGGILHNTGNIH